MKIQLINKYWLFKQFNILQDLNIYFLNILYQELRPREFTSPSLYDFNNNVVCEGNELVCYSQNIRYTDEITDWICMLWNYGVEEISISENYGVTCDYNECNGYECNTFCIDFENSLIRKEDVYLKSGQKISYGYSLDSVFGVN